MTAPTSAWRAHEKRDKPDFGLWHFADTTGGRFNLADPEGTCYMANDATTALRERLGRVAHNNVVPASELSNVLVSEAKFDTEDRLADLCHVDAIKVVGINREIYTTSDFETTQAWAAHFRSERLAGIRYQPRHTMSTHDRSYAIFGPGRIVTSIPGTRRPATEVAEEAGLAIVGLPALSQVQVVEPPK